VPVRGDCMDTTLGYQLLQSPQHFDGVYNTDVGVVEVVQRAQGKGRQRPNQTYCYVWNNCAAVEKGGPNIVHHNRLDAPVGVEDGEGAEERVCEGGRVQEGHHADRQLGQGDDPLCCPHSHMVAGALLC